MTIIMHSRAKITACVSGGMLIFSYFVYTPQRYRHSHTVFNDDIRKLNLPLPSRNVSSVESGSCLCVLVVSSIPRAF